MNLCIFPIFFQKNLVYGGLFPRFYDQIDITKLVFSHIFISGTKTKKNSGLVCQFGCKFHVQKFFLNQNWNFEIFSKIIFQAHILQALDKNYDFFLNTKPKYRFSAFVCIFKRSKNLKPRFSIPSRVYIQNRF